MDNVPNRLPQSGRAAGRHATDEQFLIMVRDRLKKIKGVA